MNYKKIGEYIANKRKEKNLTQQELADKMHVSVKAISKWECGKGIPEISNLQILAKNLDVTIIDILNGKDSKKEDVVVEYVKKKDNETKKIFALLFVMLFLLFISSFLVLFVKYKNFYNVNYNNNRIIKFSGGTDKIGYNDMLLVISPDKRVLVTGEILPNRDIKLEDFRGYSIYYKEKLIASRGCKENCYTNLMPVVLIEDGGYDELFTEEAVADVDNWRVEISYKVGDEIEIENIKLISEEVSKTDKTYATKVEPISGDNENAADEDEEEYTDSYKSCKNAYLIDIALKNGFELPEDNVCEVSKWMSDEPMEWYDVEVSKKRFSYNYDNYGMFITKKNKITVYGDENNKAYEYVYYYDKGKQSCTKGKCPKPNMEVIERFVKLTNEYFPDEKLFTK